MQLAAAESVLIRQGGVHGDSREVGIIDKTQTFNAVPKVDFIV